MDYKLSTLGDSFFLDVPSLNFSGMAIPSPNGRFFAAGRDNLLAVVDMDKKHLLFAYDIFSRIDTSTLVVTDQPLIVVRDIVSLGPDRRNDIYLLNHRSDILFRETINSHIHRLGLSPKGEFLAVQLNDFSICLYDIPNQRLISSWNAPTAFCSGIDIDSKQKVITLIRNAEGHNYRYSFEGELLDKALWNEHRRQSSNGYILIDYIDEIQNEPLSSSQLKEVITLLDKALEANISSKRKAEGCKIVGSILEAYMLEREALGYFKKAIDFDTRIGVKRKIAELEQKS